MARLFIIVAFTLGLFSSTAFAGKANKFDGFSASYRYVVEKVGRKSSKGKKANALMRQVRKGMKSMDRGAFYSFVDQKEAQLMKLAN